MLRHQPSPEVIAWRTGDGHAEDVRGDHHGTPQQRATRASGRIESAVAFDETTGSVTVGVDTDFESETIAVKAWLKCSSSLSQASTAIVPANSWRPARSTPTTSTESLL